MPGPARSLRPAMSAHAVPAAANDGETDNRDRDASFRRWMNRRWPVDVDVDVDVDADAGAGAGAAQQPAR